MFINRINELQKLNDEYNKKSSSFSVIYGRRRVGKTALISEFIKDKPHIYLYITQGDLINQVESFTIQIRKFVDVNIANYLRFDSFENAIEFLATLNLEQKLILCLMSIKI